MSSVVTFYSYKGGVGRSMALANIAILLARRGLKVLTVDWDLEAPGLERYFSSVDIKSSGPGLLGMFMQHRKIGTANFADFVSSVDYGGHPITLLPSGREQDVDYSRNLENFDWIEFFARGGGDFIESLRHQWLDKFDIVLIDSRTGLTDAGGICTIQLPDIVVAMFTANFQSLFGVRDVMRLVQKARQNLAYDRMRLSVLPLPSRWGIQEFQETKLWLDRVSEGVQEFCQDWLPRNIPVRDVIERIKLPQSDYFGFGERLAVVEQGVGDPLSLGFVYDKIASFLASDFRDISTLMGKEALRTVAPVSELRPDQVALKARQKEDYLYDIFVSADESVSLWVLEFVDQLKDHIAMISGAPPRIFKGLSEIKVGELWEEQAKNALIRSRILLAVITPRYVSNPRLMREFLAFSERAHVTGGIVLLPVILSGENFPDPINRYQHVDLRAVRGLSSSARRNTAEWQPRLRELAFTAADLIKNAPPYDPNWAAESMRRIAKPDVFAEISPAPSLLPAPAVKRLLSIDGGGLAGLIPAECLIEMERQLDAITGRSAPLCERFELIGGTGTGAIIAAGLTLGLRANALRDFYLVYGQEIFTRVFFLSQFRHRYSKEPLEKRLKEVFGSETTLGSERLRTNILLVAKNATLGTTWFFTNNRNSKYFSIDGSLPLWQIVRASAATPSYFPPQFITVPDSNGTKSEYEFVDGSFSTYNNPSLQLFFEATEPSYGFGWPTGPEKLLLISLGTGFNLNQVRIPTGLASKYTILDWTRYSMRELVNSANLQQNLLMQLISQTQTGRVSSPLQEESSSGVSTPSPAAVDQLSATLGAGKLLTYQRINVGLTRERLDALGLLDIDPVKVAEIDAADQIVNLQRIGAAVAKEQVRMEALKRFHWEPVVSATSPTAIRA